MIPYTLAPRRDTGVSNQSLGLWLFLASEVMLFGALFSAYALLRLSVPAWPDGSSVLSVAFGATNTIILFLMTGAAWRARSLPASRAARTLWASSALAVAFLIVKTLEYRGELAQDLVPAASTFLAMYYTLTGLHALHVLGGLAANVWALAGRAGEAMTLGRIRLLSVYWAFVDIVWVILFVLLYLS